MSVTPLPAIPVQGEGDNSQALIGNLPAPYAGGQIAKGAQVGILGNRSDMDTPFSMHGYTQQAIQNRQAQSIADVMDYDPSVRVISSRGGYTDQYMIRGFTVFNDDLAFNGMYGIVPRQTYTPEALERGYHETVTVAWLRLVHFTLGEYGPAATADEFLDTQEHLLNRKALRFFYTRDHLISWRAKAEFVPPDLTPLPQSAKA